MAKVRFESGARSFEAIGRVMKSKKLGAALEEIARPVFEQAKQDPNEYYASTLEMRQFVSSGKAGRVSIQIGAAPTVGGRVEAKRGTLARALGLIG